MAFSPLVRQPPHLRPNQTHSWQTQCFGRHFIQERLNHSYGMVTRSFGPSLDLGVSDDQSVCDEVESPVAHLCLPGFRPKGLGRGRSVDALSISWEGLWAYAYPPTVLVLKIIQRLRGQNCQMILIAPLSWNKSWVTDLFDLSIDLPRKLPTIPHLLQQPRS